MADIKKIHSRKTNTTYNIKDAVAREQLATKQDAITDVSVNYQEDGGSPDASAQFENGTLAFSMKNMKMRFSELTTEEKASLKGENGRQGDSVIVGEGDLPLAHVLGDDNTKAISQMGATDAVADVLQWAYSVNELKSYIQRSNNVFRYIEMLDGIIRESGAIETSTGWRYSNVFAISPNMQYIGSDVSNTYIALYDINMTFKRRVSIRTSFTTNADEVYARITSNLQNPNFIWLNEGDTLLERDEFFIKISGDALDLEPFRNSLGLDVLAEIDADFAYALYKGSASVYDHSGYVSINGNEIDGTARRRTGYLSYNGGNIIAYGASGPTTFPLMVFFDNEKNCLDYFPNPRTGDLNNKMVVVKAENIPEGTAFVRFNGNTDRIYYNNLADITHNYVDEETVSSMISTETNRAMNAEASIKEVTDYMLKKSTNLADKSGLIKKASINTEGEIEAVSQSYYACENYIPIKSSFTYTSQRCRLIAEYQYDEDNDTYIFIKRHNFTSGGSIHTFTTDANATHLRFSGIQAYASIVQINEGDTLLDYEPFSKGYNATDDFVNVIQNSIGYETSKYFYGPYDIRKSDFQSWYSGLQNDYTLFGVGGSPERAVPDGAWATTYADVIAAYDALMAEDPTYITKNELGTASGTDANDNPYTLYEYVFKPKRYDGVNKNNKVVPKILIDGCIHGFERNSSYGLFYFLKDIVENWDKNEALKALRCHVEIHVIPIVNPYGFDNFTYTNGNRVNINRNFACGNWTVVPVGDKDATGEEPFDQPETAIVRDWILENSDTLLMYINCHTDGQYNASSYANANHWMLCSDIDDAYYMRLFNVGTRHIEEQTLMFPTMYPNVTPTGFVGIINIDAGKTTSKGTAKQWACAQMNFLSMTLEGFNAVKVDDVQIFGVLSADSQKANSEIIGNTVIQICYEYADN